jgi:hypothetical protein
MYKILLTDEEYKLIQEALEMYREAASGEEIWIRKTGPSLPRKIRILMVEKFSCSQRENASQNPANNC